MSIPPYVCCPACHDPLVAEDGAARCATCGERYPTAPSGQIDLRPRRPLTRSTAFVVDPIDPLWSPGHTSPSLRDASVRELRQIVPRAAEPGATALEVGCGPRGDVRAVLANAGYRWVGVDWEAAPATYLADVHALPFRDGAFALVASDAVLEHVRYPHLGIAEMARVLRPGGVMVGEVAFLQPFHASYFHMTHEAILDLVRYAGLEPTLYAGGATSSFLYLARKAVRRWAWLAWPVARAFRTVARRRGGDHDIHFACSVLFAARKPS